MEEEEEEEEEEERGKRSRSVGEQKKKPRAGRRREKRVRSKRRKRSQLAAAAATIAGHSKRGHGLSLHETPPTLCSAHCPRSTAQERGRRRAKQAVERGGERR